MPNEDQKNRWNGATGDHWRKEADLLDQMFAVQGQVMLGAAQLQSGMRVFDIGCGGGATTLEAQRRVGPSGLATGLDVSEPLLSLARERAEKLSSEARFELQDASSWVPEGLGDAIVSRFGVMFFDDPVAAFANMRAFLKPRGRMSFMCWGDLRANELMTTPMAALKPLLKEPLAKPDPQAPGPGAFADQDRVNRILSEAGWADIEIVSWEGHLFPPGDNLSETAEFLLMLAAVVREAASEQGIELAPLHEALCRNLEAYVQDGKVQLKAVNWVVTARA